MSDRKVTLIGGPADGAVIPEPIIVDEVNVHFDTGDGEDIAHYRPIDGEWRWVDTTKRPRSCAWCGTTTPACGVWSRDDAAWWCWEPCYELANAAAGTTPNTCPDCANAIERPHHG